MDRIRKEYLQKRNEIPKTERALFSKAICCAIINASEYSLAQSVMCYMAIGSEVDLSVLIAHALHSGKQVLLPKCDKQNVSITPCVYSGRLVPGAYGIPEPDGGPAEPGLIVCPMLAFNSMRFRVGYGAGYYDRLLAGSNAVIFGAAFASQRAEFTGHAHDVPMHRIFTQEEIF